MSALSGNPLGAVVWSVSQEQYRVREKTTVTMTPIRWLYILTILLPQWPMAADAWTYGDLVSRLTGMERLAEPVPEGELTGASTSRDRGSSYDAATDRYQNWSANDDGRGFIRREGDGQVLVDLQGPGVLWRVWSAKAEGGHIRIYLDGNETPVIDKPFRTFFDDLERDYPGLAMTLSRGRNSFVPIPFAKSCKVVMQDGWGAYFHATHTLFPKNTEVPSFPGFTQEVVSVLKEANEAWLKPRDRPHAGTNATLAHRTLLVKPGATDGITLQGCGAIRGLKIRPLELPEDRIEREDILRELTIAIHWDGERKPSVWAPLGDFFATSPGLNPFKTRPMGCVDGGFYSHWFMPYSQGMRLVLVNDGVLERKVFVELETTTIESAAADKLLRFCAAWHAADFTGLDADRFPRKGDRWPDWPLLVVRGSGRFVGMSQHVWKFGGWWGEGDEKFFVDGEKFPSTFGTGSEDYIGYAWAADPPFVTFNSPSAAVTRIRPDANEDTSVCRFHLCDDIPFHSGFEGFIEVMPNNDCRPVIYDQCVYWYRGKGAENPYPVVPLAERRHLRPSSQMKHIVPATYQTLKPRPGILEGENLKVLRIGSGRHWIQDMSGFPGDWSGDAQLIWTEGKPGDEIEIGFSASQDGRAKLFASFTKAPDYGVFELSVDGRVLKPELDLFDEQVGRTDEISLGIVDLAPGGHILKVKALGRNPKAKGGWAGDCLFGLDCLRVE